MSKLRDVYRYRAKLVILNLRFCNSAADIHAVNNMRNTAELLIDAINCHIMSEKRIAGILKRLEKDELEFFKKKFMK